MGRSPVDSHPYHDRRHEETPRHSHPTGKGHEQQVDARQQAQGAGGEVTGRGLVADCVVLTPLCAPLYAEDIAYCVPWHGHEGSGQVIVLTCTKWAPRSALSWHQDQQQVGAKLSTKSAQLCKSAPEQGQDTLLWCPQCDPIIADRRMLRHSHVVSDDSKHTATTILVCMIAGQ